MKVKALNEGLAAFANIGVLVGLAVLIVEIKQNNDLTLAQIEQNRSDSLLQWREAWVLNDHIPPLLTKVDGIRSELTTKSRADLSAEESQAVTEKIIDSLEPVERRRYVSFIARDYWDLEQLYFQFQRGLVSESYWNERIVPAISTYAPRWKAAFNGRLPSGGRPEFNAEVERILRESH